VCVCGLREAREWMRWKRDGACVCGGLASRRRSVGPGFVLRFFLSPIKCPRQPPHRLPATPTHHDGVPHLQRFRADRRRKGVGHIVGTCGCV
jgi:hypothetical protein